MGVGFFRGDLKEAHVDGIKEVLLLAVVRGVFGVALDGVVEKGSSFLRKSSRLSERLVSSAMTFSISAATTLRWEKLGDC